MLNSLAVWRRVHAPAHLMALFALVVSTEMVFGELPLPLPYGLSLPAQWGLVLPVLSMTVLVNMLYTGLGELEKPTAPGWVWARATWFLLLVIAAALPAVYVHDGLGWEGSLRNRLILFCLGTLLALVIPQPLVAVPLFLIVLITMLVGGGLDLDSVALQTKPALLLVHEHLEPWERPFLACLVLATAAVYATCYPGRTRDHSAGETVS
ncbi:hypothetical protein KRX56_02430 [Dermabacteraceae bacterium TAE3-ERU27]|nr:hypothetical protein [Dermabacteraceae bacterium TAE3-ERU27]